jgi:GNAT superfamily N-acetyltransferase
VEIRPVGADDLEQELDLRVRAFGPLGDYRERVIADNLELIAAGQMLGAYEGNRLVGTARCLNLRQWWGGRDLPMAGVSGVKVAPEARGRGVATALLTELMSAMTERGFPISVLFPSTPGLYRSLGWEFAGGFYRTEIVGRALTTLLPPDVGVGPGAPSELQRVGPDDAEQVIAVMNAVHATARDCGPTAFGVDIVRRDLADEDEFAYLAGDGFLSYGFAGSSHAIEVSHLAAGSAATAAAFWGILGSHSTVTRTVGAYVSPSDPIGWLVRDRDIEVRLDKRSMLRVIDPVGAVAGRGFPAGVQASVGLRLVDAVLPANSGDYRLTVSEGTGSLVKMAGPVAGGPVAGGLVAGGPVAGGPVGAGPVGAGPKAGAQKADGPLILGARGFATLFAGTPVSTLRAAGLAAGGDATADALIDSAFACTPFMTDSF